LRAFIVSARTSGINLEAQSSTDTVHGYAIALTDDDGNVLAGRPLRVCFYERPAKESKTTIAVYPRLSTISGTIKSLFLKS
jgi:hypothetical protein